MARIATIRSVTKVASSLISFTELFVLGSFNATFSNSKTINLLFDGSLLFPYQLPGSMVSVKVDM